MANGIRITGLSGDVSSVSVQSTVARTWALLGRKWAGLRYKEHDVELGKDELVVMKCHGGRCVLELESLGSRHGDTIVQQDVSRWRLRKGERRRIELFQGGAISITTAMIKHPLERHGPIIET